MLKPPRRRSGGKTPKLDRDELAAIYVKQLEEQGVRSYSDFRRARLGIDAVKTDSSEKK